MESDMGSLSDTFALKLAIGRDGIVVILWSW